MSSTGNGRRKKLGVMGSASGPLVSDAVAVERSRALGRAVARRDCILITGACPGLPHEALVAAKEAGAFTLGVSPAFSHHEHTAEYKSPDDGFDLLLYTSMGFMERDIVNIRASDGVLFLGGGVGTLNEFTVAFEEGKPVGILTGLGGVMEHVEQILAWCRRPMHPNIVLRDDPDELVDALLQAIEKYPTPVHEDGRVTDVKFGHLRG